MFRAGSCMPRKGKATKELRVLARVPVNLKAERKEERVRQRRHLASRVEVPAKLSFLEAVTIGKGTCTEYTRKVENFVS